jgi:hypothetical protein
MSNGGGGNDDDFYILNFILGTRWLQEKWFFLPVSSI